MRYRDIIYSDNPRYHATVRL